MDAKALYIVSGDNDLLDIKEYDGIQEGDPRAFMLPPEEENPSVTV